MIRQAVYGGTVYPSKHIAQWCGTFALLGHTVTDYDNANIVLDDETLVRLHLLHEFDNLASHRELATARRCVHANRHNLPPVRDVILVGAVPVLDVNTHAHDPAELFSVGAWVPLDPADQPPALCGCPACRRGVGIGLDGTFLTPTAHGPRTGPWDHVAEAWATVTAGLALAALPEVSLDDVAPERRRATITGPYAGPFPNDRGERWSGPAWLVSADDPAVLMLAWSIATAINEATDYADDPDHDWRVYHPDRRTDLLEVRTADIGDLTAGLQARGCTVVTRA